MNGKFGEFIAEKRKSRGLTLRGLAAELGIAPAYMSDIEKGHRYPPDKDKLYELSRILCLSEDETNTMFDLAAGERKTLCLLICRSISWAMSKCVLRFVWHVTAISPSKYGKKSLKCLRSRSEVRNKRDPLQLFCTSTGIRS